jgi:NADPH:quinone reductase
MTPIAIPCIRIAEPGGPEVLVPGELTLPPLGPRQVRVRVRASGVNRADLLERRGAYPAPSDAPRGVPGLEYAGVVEAVGPACTLRAPGDRVMGLVGGGGYAAAVQVDEAETLRIPEGTETLHAAALPEAFVTAWDAAFLQGGLEAGETLLVHAVGSGVGTAALQLALWAGARVVGTSRTADKLERAAALGLDPAGAVESGDPDWPERVRAATAGRGVDVVLDLVGGGYAPGTLATLAPRARWIVVGVPSGAEATLDLRRLMGLRARMQGTVLRSRPPAEKAELARRFEAAVVPAFEAGALEPVIDRVLPAGDAAEAHRLLEANDTFGKVLLAWGSPVAPTRGATGG